MIHVKFRKSLILSSLQLQIKLGKTLYDPTTHPSILEIKNHVEVEKNFEFQHITSDKIEIIIDKINIKKASGFDNIPAKVIKQCKPIISNQLTSLINLFIDTGVFPDSLKKNSGNTITQEK